MTQMPLDILPVSLTAHGVGKEAKMKDHGQSPKDYTLQARLSVW